MRGSARVRLSAEPGPGVLSYPVRSYWSWRFRQLARGRGQPCDLIGGRPPAVAAALVRAL